MDQDAVQKIRNDILETLLPDVPFDGWNWDGVIKAAEKADYSENMAHAVFPGGLVDVLDSFSEMADKRMLLKLSELNPEDMRIRDRIREAVIIRFEGLQLEKEAVRKSLSFWMLPFRKARAAKIVWRTADLIWEWAGDTAQDYNRYTKRYLLSGILVSTTLAWLNDHGDDLAVTKSFLDRRIENVMQFNKVLGKFKKQS